MLVYRQPPFVALRYFPCFIGDVYPAIMGMGGHALIFGIAAVAMLPRNDVLYHASLSGKQIKNPSTRITHKGAKRQKTHSPVKHYLVGFNGYNLSRSDNAQAPQAIKFGYSIFLFFRFVNDFD